MSRPARKIRADVTPPGEPRKVARVFMNGRSQAVRLPKEFRFDTDRVLVRREGRHVVLSPMFKDWDDYLENGETHRLVVQLNRGWTAGDGGYFLLFGDDTPEDLRVVLAPMSRQALLFEISHRSHHAVSKVVRGERYSIVYSFYAISG